MIRPIYKQIDNYTHAIILPLKEDIESFSIECYFSMGGSYHEQTGSGVSHLLEHCLLSSIDDLSTSEMDRTLYQQSVTKNGATSPHTMEIKVRGYKDDYKNITKLFDKMSFHHKFREDIFKQEKKAVISEIKEHYLSPFARMRDYVKSELYVEGSIYRNKVLGTVESVTQLKLEDMVSRYNGINEESQYVFLITGIDEKKYNVTEEIESLTRDVPKIKRKHPLNYFPPSGFKKFSYLPIVHEIAKDTVELGISIPCEVSLVNHIARFILRRMLLLEPFGELFQKLRIQKGLIYSLGAYFFTPEQTLEIHTNVPKEDIVQIMEEVAKIFDPRKIDSIRAQFDDVKKSFLKHQLIIYENRSYGTMNMILDNLFEFNQVFTVDDYLEQCKNVTFELIEKTFLNWCENYKNKQVWAVSSDEGIRDIHIP